MFSFSFRFCFSAKGWNLIKILWRLADTQTEGTTHPSTHQKTHTKGQKHLVLGIIQFVCVWVCVGVENHQYTKTAAKTLTMSWPHHPLHTTHHPQPMGGLGFWVWGRWLTHFRFVISIIFALLDVFGFCFIRWGWLKGSRLRLTHIAFYWGWFVFGIGHLCISFDNEITYLCHLCWFGCINISKFGESFRRISLKSIHFKLKQKSTDFCTFIIKKKRNIDLKYINKIVIVKMYIKSQISLLNIKIIVFDTKNGFSIF